MLESRFSFIAWMPCFPVVSTTLKLRPAHTDGRDRTQLLQHPTYLLKLRGASAHGNPPGRRLWNSAMAVSIPWLRTGRTRFCGLA
jgi:hypothetical protein